MEIFYTPRFKREFKKLPEALQDEANEKISLFTNPSNHKQLSVHLLKGPLKGSYSFSVNYRYRIVFRYLGRKKQAAALLSIGDHGVYDI